MSTNPKVHWTEVTLFFADGSGLTSRWQDGRAEQRGGRRQMVGAIATAEHLRALHELCCAGAATNWFTNTALDGAQSPTAEQIDWSGLPDAAEPEDLG